MEKRVRSSLVEIEEETLLRWKWITLFLVLLSYFLLLFIWMPKPIGKGSCVQDARAVVLDDEALLSALNLSKSLRALSPSIENFLLAGGSSEKEIDGTAEPQHVPLQGWSDGEWSPLPESSDEEFLQHPRMMGRSVREHRASFSVNQDRRGWLEWSSSSVKTPVRAVEGVLELGNFWDRIPTMEALTLAEASGAKMDFNQILALQNLKVYLSGVSVDTRAGRRLYMTGCAYRIDHAYKIDCGFQLKMTYRHSRQSPWTPGKVQAELSRRTPGADKLLRFPTIRIQAIDIIPVEYTSKVTYLPSVAERNNFILGAHLRRPSPIDEAAELAK